MLKIVGILKVFGTTAIGQKLLWFRLTICNVIYYIVESEILKNTQHLRYFPYLLHWRYRSRDNLTTCFWAWNFTMFCLGLYIKQNITRWLEDMIFIWRRRLISSIYFIIVICYVILTSCMTELVKLKKLKSWHSSEDIVLCRHRFFSSGCVVHNTEYAVYNRIINNY
jgi:hypothetical protein